MRWGLTYRLARRCTRCFRGFPPIPRSHRIRGYVEEPDGARIPCSEPNEYAYAVGEGCHIALALDRGTVEAYGVNTGNIDDASMDALLEAWCVEINDDLADDSGRDGLMSRTLHRVAYDMGFASSDGE